MRTLRMRINPNGNPSRQQPSHIIELVSLLKDEGLVYPQLADAYGLLAKWCDKALERFRADTESGVMAYASEFRTSGLKAAREKLGLDVVCTG